MKVALVSPYDWGYPGGVNVHVRHLAQALRARNEDARVLASVPAGTPVPAHVIPLAGRLVTVSSGGARARVNLDPRVVRDARALLRRHRFDIVHLHNPLSPLVSLGVLASRPLAPDAAFVATFHEYRARLNPAMELAKRLLRPLVDRLDGRIAVSPIARDFNRRRFPGDYTVIPNGVDVARFRRPSGAVHTDAGGRPTILFVGRLEARKGFAHLLNAWPHVVARFPEARLVVVGPYDRTAIALPARGIELVGEVSDDALPDYYRAADVFCAPSVDFESFGIVLLEAMAAGAPIVASDIPAYRGVITAGRDGLLVAPARPAAIASAIASLLEDPARRRAMRAAGLETVQSFDWETVADRVLAFYREVCAARRGRAAGLSVTAGASSPSGDL